MLRNVQPGSIILFLHVLKYGVKKPNKKTFQKDSFLEMISQCYSTQSTWQTAVSSNAHAGTKYQIFLFIYANNVYFL